MHIRPTYLFSVLLYVAALVQAGAQAPTRVLVGKTDFYRQISASAPAIDSRLVGAPEYGQRYQFNVKVGADTDLSGIAAPTVTLAAGSNAPAIIGAGHNGGVLVWNTGDDEWRYGTGGFQWATNDAALRDTLFANGTYTLNVLGTSVALNLSATPFGPNPPQVTMTGGTWSSGRYLIDVNQPLTITTNVFANYAQNANGAISLQVYDPEQEEDILDELAFHSANPFQAASPSTDSLTHTFPAGTFVAGRSYEGEVCFYAVTDQVAGTPGSALAGSLNAAFREHRTFFRITAYSDTPPAVMYGVGDIPGGATRSSVREATKVGDVIYAVGGSNRTNATAVDIATLWTLRDGIIALPDLVVNTSTGSTEAMAITPDAAYIASRAHSGSLASDRRAVRVTTSGLVNLDLGALPGFDTAATVNSISNDGSVLYGVATYATGKSTTVRFTAAGPTITPIPFLKVGDDNSNTPVHGSSADGSVMVGNSGVGSVGTSPGNQAFRYVQGVGVSAIPYLPGGTWNNALAVSPDGNLVLVRGNSTAFPNGEVFLYKASTATIKSLGSPNPSVVPGNFGRITADGSVVAVSIGTTFYFRNANGWKTLAAEITRSGLDLTDDNWTVTSLLGMSSDGTLICGAGQHNGFTEGFVIEFSSGFLNGIAPVITSASTAAGTYAQAFNYTITANNQPEEFDALNLPAPLAVNNNTGVISGVPSAAGTFPVVIVASNSAGSGIKDLLLTIAPASAAVQLGDMTQFYDGTPRPVTVATTPTGLTVNTTYDGSASPPVGIGSYSVVATLNEPNYSGSASATLNIVTGPPGSTPVGNDVAVTPPAVDGNGDPFPTAPAVGLNFDQVTAPGNTTLLVTGSGPAVPGTYALGTPPLFFDLVTTATFSGNVEIAINYTGLSFDGNPADLILAHYVNGAWVNITSGNDTTNRVIRGVTDSFSMFAILQPVTVTLSGLAHTYDGSAKSATVNTTPAGLAVTFTYNGSTTPPTDAGDYAVVATISDPTYLGSATGTLSIATASAGVIITGTGQSFDGSPKTVGVTTTPEGLPVIVTYDGSLVAPTNAGSYAVVATVSDPNYQSSASDTLAITQGSALVTLSDLSQTYTGSARAATFTTTPAGLAVNVTYDGSASAPTNAGSYAVVATVTDPNYSGSATGTLTVSQASATVTLGNLAQIYDATPKAATATTTPAGLNVSLTYNGGAAAPTAVGSYAVIGTVVEANYQGSANGTLVIGLAPLQIVTQPVAATSVVGQTATFTVVATGTGPISYQWRKGTTNIAGATSATLSLPNVQTTDAGNYRVVVSNVAGSINSSVAALTVITPVTITAQPQNLTRNTGQTASFSVTATGTTPLTYQWRLNGVDLASSTTRTLALGAVTPANEGLYSVVVTNAAGSVASADASLTVLVPPAITTQPVATSAVVGDTVQFSVTATGTAPLNYQWRLGSTPIAGATSPTLTLTNVQSTDAGSYRVVVSNAAGSVTSTAAALTVITPVTITVQPLPLTRSAGQTATFTVTATGTGPISYQWQKDGSDIAGATTRTFKITSSAATDAGIYRVVVTNAAGSVISSDVSLTVNVAPTITTPPAPVTVAAGGTAVFTVVAGGTEPFTYQWKKGNTVIAGATSATLTLTNVQPSAAGNYKVTVTNVVGSVTSSTATLTVQ